MTRNQHPIVAAEGVPFLLLNGFVLVAVFHWFGWILALAPLFSLLALVLLFRDPARDVPAAPLDVLSPCDGTVLSVEPTDRGVLEREALRLVIRVNNFGAYTARSPIEGKVLDPRDNVRAGSRLLGINGLWVRSEALDDIITLFRGPRYIGAPAGFIRYGERIGQGQRCAYLRLARQAAVLIPANATPLVKKGDRVIAGKTALARLRSD